MPNTNLPADVVVSMDAPVARQHLETDAARAEVVNDVDEVAQVAPQPVELPDNEGVPATQGLESADSSTLMIRPAANACGGSTRSQVQASSATIPGQATVGAEAGRPPG